jgi:predicted pyridoxine 5'-phosphate oxidase superfamily flavin-nucleotide-binding protein
MTSKAGYTTDIAFTPSVKAMQEKLGSRSAMRRMEESNRWQTKITPDLSSFLKARNSIYLGSASADGQPYIQHRGGPPGFIRVIDDKHFEIDDYPGNQHYISLGNFSENTQAFVFAIDYERKQRIKIWGTINVMDLPEPSLTGHVGSIRALSFCVEAWDINCRSHLPDLYHERTVEKVTEKKTTRIVELEAEVARLRAASQ